MYDDPIDRPTFVDRFIIFMVRPENLARIINWVWRLSILMLLFGYVLIYMQITGKFSVI